MLLLLHRAAGVDDGDDGDDVGVDVDVVVDFFSRGKFSLWTGAPLGCSGIRTADDTLPSPVLPTTAGVLWLVCSKPCLAALYMFEVDCRSRFCFGEGAFVRSVMFNTPCIFTNRR